jgi:hypothetical protein
MEFARRQTGQGLEGTGKVWLICESGPNGDIAEWLARSDSFAGELYSPTPNIFADTASELLTKGPCEVSGMYICIRGQDPHRLPAIKFGFQFLLNLSKPQRNAAGGGASALQLATEL